MKHHPGLLCILPFFLFFQRADAQKYAYRKAEVFLFKSDFTDAKKIDDATYLLQVVKHSDTEYVCRYYNKFGPMTKQETFIDSNLSVPNGTFLWYDQKGIADSEAVVYRGRKTSFTIFDDKLKAIISIKYRNGNMYEKKDWITNVYTDSAGNTHNLAEREEEERNRFQELKKSQTDTSEIEPVFPGGVGAWNAYIDKNLLIPDRFRTNLPEGRYDAIVSFRINKEGKVDEVKLLRSVEWSADLEIFKLYENSPSWQPAVQFGKTVSYRQKQNIPFMLGGIILKNGW